jgi:hypothetical protein
MPPAAVDRAADLAWKTFPTLPHTNNTGLNDVVGDTRTATYYALAFV